MKHLKEIQVRSYKRFDVMSRRFFDDLYVFDMTCQSEIVGARAPFSRSNMGALPPEWLSYEDRSAVERYLMSYAERPLLCDSREGALLFVPNLAPSSSLGIVMRLELDVKYALKLIDHCGFEVELSNELLTLEKGRLGKRIKEKSIVIESLARDVKSCFGGLALSRDLPRRMNERLIKRIDAISYLVGCPVCLDFSGAELVDYGDFDEGVFCAFLLLSTLLARRLSETRGVDVALTKNEALGITVSAEISLVPNVKEMVPEIITLRSIANRKNMFFDFSVSGEHIYMCIAPANKDWSFLEIKHPDVFDWDN